MTDPGDTAQLLELLRHGNEQARSRLIAHSCERLRCLTRRMLKGYPCVRRWEQTDDVLQNALLRLCRALEMTTPESPSHYYRLAAQHIRWELIDMARHYQGPQGHGANHDTDGSGKAADDEGGPLSLKSWEGGEPDSLEAWTTFHQQVEALPVEERDLVDLLWYEGRTQEEAALALQVSLRTVKRRWQCVRLKLAAALTHQAHIEAGEPG